MTEPLNIEDTKAEEISRLEAARLLGVSSATIRRYAIPFRQYGRREHCIYNKADVLRFRQESLTSNGQQATCM